MIAAQRELSGGKILAASDGPIGYLTLNQPEKRNAMSIEMWDGLIEMLKTWDSDPAVRVVVLTGAGGKAFASGADISQFKEQRSDAEAQAKYASRTAPGWSWLRQFSKPIIAQIRGYCLGGGMAIAMMADVRICAEGSTLGIPAARMGLPYRFDVVQLLISLVGQSNARLILYAGDRYDAAEAHHMGLVNSVVPDDQLEETVRALALRIARNAPLSVNYSKFAIGQAMLDPADRDVGRVHAMAEACYASEDFKEAGRAFMEKRAPFFTGS